MKKKMLFTAAALIFSAAMFAADPSMGPVKPATSTEIHGGKTTKTGGEKAGVKKDHARKGKHESKTCAHKKCCAGKAMHKE